jgi:1-aminocyclopropane-1-carboxylate deaminase
MADFADLPRAPLQRVSLDWARAAGVELAVLRLDQVDPLISGNKSYKLAGYWQQAKRIGARGLISLGGAHSNHLHALAAAGQRLGFSTVGLLRGEPQHTPTVTDLQAFGMQLHWLGYSGYRARHRADFWAQWQALYPQLLPVPEGGGGLLGAQGCEALVDQARDQLPWPDYYGWWLACGTGTTLAGLVRAEAGAHPVYGALAVPMDHGVPEQVAALAGPNGYELFDASRGGFGKVDDALLAFMADCEQQMGMLLEPLYTAKALWALREAVREGWFAAGTRLIYVHTGGLQGRRGFSL